MIDTGMGLEAACPECVAWLEAHEPAEQGKSNG